MKIKSSNHRSKVNYFGVIFSLTIAFFSISRLYFSFSHKQDFRIEDILLLIGGFTILYSFIKGISFTDLIRKNFFFGLYDPGEKYAKSIIQVQIIAFTFIFVILLIYLFSRLITYPKPDCKETNTCPLNSSVFSK